jgi:hypothetical protein
MKAVKDVRAELERRLVNRLGFISIGFGHPFPVIIITVEERHKDAYTDLPEILKEYPYGYRLVYGVRPKAL